MLTEAELSAARLEVARAALKKERDPKGMSCPYCGRPMLEKIRRNTDEEFTLVVHEFWYLGLGCIAIAASALILAGVVSAVAFSALIDWGPGLGLAVGMIAVGTVIFIAFLIAAGMTYRERLMYQCIACGRLVE